MEEPEVDEPAASLGAELRRLRIEAGEPPFRSLAHTTGYGRTTLHDALQGNRLPTLDVTLGLVRALGGNEDEWRARWVAARAALDARRPSPPAATPPMDAQAGGNAGEPGPEKLTLEGERQTPRGRPKGRRAILAGVVAMLLIAATALAVNLATRDPFRLNPDRCERVRQYRITASGNVLASHGDLVGTVVPGDTFKALRTNGAPYYAHRYYGIVLRTRSWGYVDQSKLEFSAETCL